MSLTRLDLIGSDRSFVNQADVTGNVLIDQSSVEISDHAEVIIDVVETNITKTADKEFVQAGDTINYTITFTNNSTLDMSDVVVIDSISAWTTVVPGSIVPTPQTGETLATGINLGSVSAGASKTLTFSVTVNANVANDIQNTAYANYTFVDSQSVQQTVSTETVTATTRWVNVKIEITKSANKYYVTRSGEEIIFTLFVTNPSNEAITGVRVVDTLPSGMTYKANSTLINDSGTYVDQNPEDGIEIGTLASGGTYKIVFTAIAAF